MIASSAVTLATRREITPKLGYLVVVAGAALWLVPLLWMLVASVRPQAFGGLAWPRSCPTPSRRSANFVEAWESADFPRYYLNTLHHQHSASWPSSS